MHKKKAGPHLTVTEQAAEPLPDLASQSWLVWQLADSAFPTGGFAHSGGIESASHHAYIHSSSDLRDFLRQNLHQTLFATIPFVLAAYDQTQTYLELDGLLDATLSNHVANRASRAEGAAFLATTEKTFHHPLITSLRTESLTNNYPTHFPIVFGTILQILHIPRETTIRLYLFLNCRTILSAAVRLGIVGPIQAQQIQSDFTPELECLSQRAASLTLADAAQTSPLLELLQATQDRLYSRLFQS